MLWLGLFLPRLPIDVFLQGIDNTPGSDPLLAVCDRTKVLHASPAALALGIRPGIKRATALAQAASLQIVERAPAIEQDALERLASWALQFTPCVSLQASSLSPRPGSATLPAPRAAGTIRRRSTRSASTAKDFGLLLEIEPSLRLFGGRDALIARLREGIAQLGFSAQLGCAPTAAAAWLFCRHADGILTAGQAHMNAQLAELPVEVLDYAAPHLDSLQTLGIANLRDLVQLPRAGLARRFGKDLLGELDRALGREPDPRIWFTAPERFSARLELLAQVEHAQGLLFGARRLLMQLAGWLGARHAATRTVQIRIEHDDLPPTIIELRAAEPTRDAQRLSSLLRERLAITRLAQPAHTLALHCEQIHPLAAGNEELFPVPASMHESLGRLIERLGARLGHNQVQRLLLVQDHRPESAWRAEAVDDMATLGPTGQRTTEHALPRPIWLLPRPVALTERSNRPYWHGPLTLLAGPERIESGWWDGALVQRDYFIASDESGAMLWLYRERVPDAQTRQGWFLHGRFG